MKEIIDIVPKDEVVVLGADLVYGQKSYWCGAGYYPLKMSLLRPRTFFYYDPKKEPRPCIVFLCGGGWTEVDHNVWIPELTYFAKHGYVVASVSYSLAPTWFHPEPLKDVKLAIRYLRAHAEELGIDPKHIAVMGESAGAYFAAMAAVTGETLEFDQGDYLEQSSSVQCAVTWYACIDLPDLEGRGEYESYRTRPQYLMRGLDFEPQSLYAGRSCLRDDIQLSRAVDPRSYITKKTPPFLLLHGTADSQVDVYNSQTLYESLQRQGVKSDFLIVKGAEHADARFLQEPIKERILQFLQENI